MANVLKASIAKVQSKAKTHDTVLVKVTIANTSGQDVSVLTWNTPLDRLLSDCFDVTVNGKAVEYDGPLVKRAVPAESDYLVIKAGQSVEAEYPVSDAYDTSTPGKYDIKLKTPIPDVTPIQPGIAAVAVATGRRAPVNERIAARTSLTVEKGEGAHLTLGAAARQDEKLAKAARKVVAAKSLKAATKKTRVRTRRPPHNPP